VCHPRRVGYFLARREYYPEACLQLLQPPSDWHLPVFRPRRGELRCRFLLLLEAFRPGRRVHQASPACRALPLQACQRQAFPRREASPPRGLRHLRLERLTQRVCLGLVRGTVQAPAMVPG